MTHAFHPASLVGLAATLLVGCAPVTLPEAFARGLTDSLTKQGLTAAQTACIVTGIQKQVTQADYDGLAAKDAATTARLKQVGASVAATCQTP